jgi:hypothetical protein
MEEEALRCSDLEDDYRKAAGVLCNNLKLEQGSPNVSSLA